jgi:hypothetical protein
METNCRPQAFLPNPWRNLPLPNGICYQVKPTNQPPSCTNFWC